MSEYNHSFTESVVTHYGSSEDIECKESRAGKKKQNEEFTKKFCDFSKRAF